MVSVCSLAFTWKIANFSGLERSKNEFLQSPKVKCLGVGGPEFFVNIRPWGFSKFSNGPGDDANISIHLWVDGLEGETMRIRYSFSILADDCTQTNKISDERTIISDGESSGFHNLISRKELLEQKQKLLPGGTMTIFVELVILNEVTLANELSPAVGTPALPKPVGNVEDLPKDLLNLLQSGEHADRVFIVGGVRFPAHSAILAARAPTLFKMFAEAERDSGNKKWDISSVYSEEDVEVLWSKETTENRAEEMPKASQDGANEIEVPKIKPEVFECLLQAIYTENMVQKLDEHAEDILRAADIFCLTKLKEKAETSLIDRIEVKNVSRLLLLAFDHEAPELKEKALKFLIENRSSVKGTPGWKELFRNPEVMFELFATIP